MRRIYLLLFLLLTFCPSLLSARHARTERDFVTPALDLDQQHLFDSLYFSAVTLQTRQLPDSALAVMTSAVAYYDSLLTLKGYTLPYPDNSNVVSKKKHQRHIPKREEVAGLAAAHYFLASHYRMENSVEPCLEHIEKAVTIDSINYWYTETKGEVMLALNQLPEALACYERLVKNYPFKSDPLYNLSEIYLRSDSIDQCLATLNKIEELDGINPQVTAYKFQILQNSGHIEEAFTEYQHLIQRYPYNMQYRIQLGNLQMQNGRIAEAKKTYDEAAAIEPDNAYVWVAEAGYYNVTGDQKAADDLVASALTNANLDVETKTQVMQEYLKGSYRKLSAYREEVKNGHDYTHLDTLALFHHVDSLFTAVSVMHPTASDVYDLQAEWRSAMGQDSLASECMRFAVDLKPTSQEYYEKLLYHSAQWIPLDRLIALAKEAAAQHPNCQTAYQIAAWAYQKEERNEEAIACYKEALNHVVPPDANKVSILWGFIGDLYSHIEKREEAYQCYDKAVTYNPSNYNVLNNYAYYLSLEKKNLSKAEQMALKVVQKYPDNPVYLDTYAWILYLEESYSLALFYQQHAVESLSDEDRLGNFTIYDHLGDIFVKTHDLVSAVTAWQTALQCTDCTDAETIKKKIESAQLLLK